MKKQLIYATLGLCFFSLAADDSSCDSSKSSDQKQQQQQEILLNEATSQVGMPAIKNFRERKLLKDILEMRDQEGLVTYTYLFAENTGKLIYLGETIGYGIPYATQYTNPQKVEYTNRTAQQGFNYSTIAQADPNGLFSPASAEGTWVLLRDPTSGAVKPTYIEPRIIVSPFKLSNN